MAGLSKDGIKIKKQHEIIEDLKEQAVPIFQDLVSPNDKIDTSDDSTLGRIIGLYSGPLADLWQVAQELYWAFDPNSACGVQLDNIVALSGITRQKATHSVVTLELWGDEGVQILQAINKVRSTDGNLYTLTNSSHLTRSNNIGVKLALEGSVEVDKEFKVTIVSGGNSVVESYTAKAGDTEESVIDSLYQKFKLHHWLRTYVENDSIVVETVDVFEAIRVDVTNLRILKVKGRAEGRNEQSGAIPQQKGMVTQIATPLLGWDSVNNPFDAVVGRDRETDEELRERFRVSKYWWGRNIAESLYSKLKSLDGVISVAIYDNDTEEYNEDWDLPEKSFKAVVRGGDPHEIGEAIWLNKPTGIASHGNTTVTVYDSVGYARDISFDRPVEVPIFIEIELTTGAQFPSNGAAEIRAHLINYFRTKQDIGTPVILSRLYTPVNLVEGHTVDSLRIGFSEDSLGHSNLTIKYNEIATLTSSDIKITIL